jgi:hypothetical protein
MVAPYLLEEQSGSTFSVDSGKCGNEVSTLADDVDYIHDGVVTVGVWQLHYEIHADLVPLLCWGLYRVQLSLGFVVLEFGSGTGVTGLDIEANEPGHLRPPVVAGDKL